MSTRISSALALLLLAACHREPAAQAPPAKAEAGPNDAMIDCALSGSTDFTHGCAVERVAGKQGVQLVVRHPDGGFRRFDVLTNGQGLATADGADAAKVTVRQGGIDVAVGTDRYRFPATIVSRDKP